MKWRHKTNLFPDFVTVIGYFASASIEVLSNPCVGSSPRTQIFFFLLPACKEFKIKNSERESNPIPYPGSWMIVLLNLTSPNKQSFRV